MYLKNEIMTFRTGIATSPRAAPTPEPARAQKMPAPGFPPAVRPKTAPAMVPMIIPAVMQVLTI
ncbi:MAG: hypothetical protein A2507_01545 [Candidatus Magasanikbacteria bacterium RIFOXYD12_FULL_33_17]|nr:MAG: hypothetical protein A2507_01545 [Candidatus Magasanikbacteria bacterium RIFOXYD12_FULL_33_17]